MTMKTKTIAILFNVAICVSLHSASRSSSDYSIATETLNAGGSRATSADYTSDGSVGNVSGTSSGTYSAKSGYLGQLYEVTGFTITAAPATINESASKQLIAAHTLDDTTLLAFDANLVSWSVLSGPLTAINASGLATAGAVFQNTPATVCRVSSRETRARSHSPC